MLRKHLLPISALSLGLLPCLLAACGEDRSGEQPFAPTVESVSAVADGDSARLTGKVTSSVNSSLIECGFSYGNDTLRLTKSAAVPSEAFTVVADSLQPGTYFAVAFARNGIGTSYGDTLRFTISE